jgi:hypothetical protein
VTHTVTGSPTGNNLFQIVGPAGSNIGVGSPNECGNPGVPAPPANVSAADCIATAQFSVAGKLSTLGGVAVSRAVYSADTAGHKTLDVFATSKPGQTVSLSGAGFASTVMAASGDGDYFAHVVPDAGPTPFKAGDKVTVTNSSDAPPSTNTATVVDAVTGAQATWDGATKQLTISGASSDQSATPAPTLTASWDGNAAGTALAPDATTGTPTLTRATPAPPATVTITSSEGGAVSVPVVLKSAPTTAITPPQVSASASPTGAVKAGTTVTLSATPTPASAHVTWSQTAPPAATSACAGAVITQAPTSNSATFRAPDPGAAGCTMTFKATVTDANGNTATATVDVGVAATAAPAAAPDTLTVTRARYVIDKGEWLVTGAATRTLLANGSPNQVTIYSGTPTFQKGTTTVTSGRRVGLATVDALGNWSYRELGSSIPAPPDGTITLVSSAGAVTSATAQITGNGTLPPLPPAQTFAPAPTPTATTAPLKLAALSLPTALTQGAVAAGGIPVAVALAPGTTVVQVQVLTGAPTGAAAARRMAPRRRVLLSEWVKVRPGQRTLHLHLRSRRLRRLLKPGHRYTLKVTPGTSRTKLGAATLRSFRVKRR